MIDYTKEDFTKGDQKYDVILDNVGNHSLSDCRRVLKPNGIYVLIGGGGANEQGLLGGLGKSPKGGAVGEVRESENGNDDGGPK